MFVWSEWFTTQPREIKRGLIKGVRTKVTVFMKLAVPDVRGEERDLDAGVRTQDLSQWSFIIPIFLFIMPADEGVSILTGYFLLLISDK